MTTIADSGRYAWYDQFKHLAAPYEVYLDRPAEPGDARRADDICGQAQILLRAWGGDTEYLLRGLRLALHALDLDPACAYAYGLVGLGWMGSGYVAGEDYQQMAMWEANRWMAAAMRVDDADPDALECWIEFLVSAGRLDEAQDELRALAEIIGDRHPDLDWLLCRLHARAGDYPRAAKHGRRARRRMNSKAKRLGLLNVLAVSLARAGHMEESDAAFEQLVHEAPDMVWAWQNWAVCLARDNRREQAMEACDRALALRDFGPAKYLKKELKHAEHRGVPGNLDVYW